MRFPPVQLPEAAVRLRAEIREVLAAELRAGTFEPQCDSWQGAASPEFSRKLGQRGWIGMTWPRRYGGHERTGLERFVVAAELLAAGAPVAAHWNTDRQTGPLLLRYGMEAQRLRFLPDIIRGECFFAVGLSEPDAGSDLASIRAAARREGDAWRLTGRKLWVSHAHFAHYLVVLCRTSPLGEDRRAGMTQFIVPLPSPGVTIRPVRLLSGEHQFNEVLLDDVVVPDDLVVGEVGGAWRQVVAELAFERSGPERFLSAYPLVAEATAGLGAAPGDRGAGALGRLASRLWTLHQMSLSLAAQLDAGAAPEIEAAM
ncbi:MAG: acyl-CoA dehydrogenase family protein, partial [Chloroflexi bacterium]|nr:acyl-CoA dehydrogenase family protein [Chloroflexota bacterium]